MTRAHNYQSNHLDSQQPPWLAFGQVGLMLSSLSSSQMDFSAGPHRARIHIIWAIAGQLFREKGYNGSRAPGHSSWTWAPLYQAETRAPSQWPQLCKYMSLGTVSRKIKVTPNVNPDYGDYSFWSRLYVCSFNQILWQLFIKKKYGRLSSRRWILTFRNLIFSAKTSKVQTEGRSCGQFMVIQSM